MRNLSKKFKEFAKNMKDVANNCEKVSNSLKKGKAKEVKKPILHISKN